MTDFVVSDSIQKRFKDVFDVPQVCCSPSRTIVSIRYKGHFFTLESPTIRANSCETAVLKSKCWRLAESPTEETARLLFYANQCFDGFGRIDYSKCYPGTKEAVLASKPITKPKPGEYLYCGCCNVQLHENFFTLDECEELIQEICD